MMLPQVSSKSVGFLPKVKRVARRVFVRIYKRHSMVQWSSGQNLKVLIETWPGFTKEDWIQALDSDFEGWNQLVEICFVQNSLERYALAADMEVYVSTWLTPDLLVDSPKLKWVHLTLGGVEFLNDLEIPSHLKITTASGLTANGIAEHVLGLMIALDRRFDLALKRNQRWKWDQVGILEHIRCLKGRTVGIVGLGHNGRAVANLGKAMGMQVIGLDKRTDLAPEGVEKIYAPNELSELLKKADFVVLCVSLTKETKKLIGSQELEQLGRDSYLINVSRGEVVDEDCLSWALRNGIIAGAALDVLSVEPPSRFNPLRRCPNLIITPHIAGNIYTFRGEIRKRFVQNLKVFLSSGELEGLYHHV